MKNPTVRLKISEQLMQQICTGMKEIAAQQHKSFAEENRLLMLYLEDTTAHPRQVADAYTMRYGKYKDQDIIGIDVIRVFRACRMRNIKEREKIADQANACASSLLRALAGSTVDAKQLHIPSEHSQFKRLMLLSLLNQSTPLAHSPAAAHILFMNKDFAATAIDYLLDLVRPEQQELSLSKPETQDSELQAALARTQKLLHDMQESFDAQLEESRLEAEEDFISKLNSAEYGYILDQMAAASEGFRNMRANHVRVPVEIRSMQTLVRRLSEFIEDCGVTEIAECGTRVNITAEQVGEYLYEGTPFCNNTEKKLVEIISPGWEIKERSIIIAQPRIREIKEEN